MNLEQSNTMTPDQYLEESEATEKKFPEGFYVQHWLLNDLDALHRHVTHAGDHTDMIKRHMIYGKEHNIPVHLQVASDHFAGVQLDQEQIEMLHAAFGMVTESIEFFDTVMKHVLYDDDLDGINLREEIGDMLWYQALALRLMQTPMGEVMAINIDKLKKRYPDKFEAHRALHRDLDAERKVLEGA